MRATARKHRRRDALITRGDVACILGDHAQLRTVVSRLAATSREPLHCELIALASECIDDPTHAVAEWMRLKPLLKE